MIHTAAFSGSSRGQVDAIAAGTQDVLTFAEPDEDLLVCVLPLDEFRGGDGILAIKDIQSIADLKGRSVAVSRGSLQQFYLAILLRQVGLSEADIEVVDLAAEDCRRGLHDAGGRCGGDLEPWLTHGQEVRAWSSANRQLEATRTDHRLPGDHGGRAQRAQERVQGGRARLGRRRRVLQDSSGRGRRDHGRGTWAAGSRIRPTSPRPSGASGSTTRRESGSISARRSSPARSTRPCSTRSTSGRSSAC